MSRAALTLVPILLLACEPTGGTGDATERIGGKSDEAPIDCEGVPQVCLSPTHVACEGQEDETAVDCTEREQVCGWDFDARRFGCVAAAEQCETPGSTLCLTSIDTARCSDAGLVEPGQPCILTHQACGWDPEVYDPATESYGAFACVDAPPVCGRLDEPCCGAPGACNRGLVCFEGTCRESSPGCGTLDEPCCRGSICHFGFECRDAYCAESNGNCGREGEGCCGGTVCAKDLTCSGSTCVAE
jgi:hypothetical protein